MGKGGDQAVATRPRRDDFLYSEQVVCVCMFSQNLANHPAASSRRPSQHRGVTLSDAAPVQEEPHASRKTAILAKYPKIKELMRPEPLTKWVVFGTVALQVGRPLTVSHVAVVAVRHFYIGGAVACAVLL